MKLSVAIIALLVFAGCSAVRSDFVERQFSIELLSSECVEISREVVRMSGSDVEIHGMLQARLATQRMPVGHVIIRVIDANGATLMEARTHYHRSGKLFKKSQHYPFSATLPSIPPPGSTIRVMFDAES